MLDIQKTCYLFFDFDGTIFIHRKFPKEIVDALQAVQKLGHKVILNTGRTRGSFPYEACIEAGIHFDGYIYGALDFEYNGFRYPVKHIPKRYGIAWVRYAMKHHLNLIFQTEKLEKRFYFQNKKEISRKEKKKNIILANQYFKKNPLNKMCIFGMDHTMTGYPKKPSNFLWCDGYIDAYQENTDKGKAILTFCQKEKINLDQCICFGDSLNDLEMFQMTPTSVAMSYAPPSIQALATFVATGEYGVVDGIKYYFSI